MSTELAERVQTRTTLEWNRIITISVARLCTMSQITAKPGSLIIADEDGFTRWFRTLHGPLTEPEISHLVETMAESKKFSVLSDQFAVSSDATLGDLIDGMLKAFLPYTIYLPDI